MDKEKHPLTNWYKLFSGAFCAIFVGLVLTIILSCPTPREATIGSFGGIVTGVGCVVLGIAAIAAFIIGLLPNILGWQHVKSRKRSAAFFYAVFWIYLLGFIMILWLKFLR